MSKLKLEYEILISGIYPFEGTLQKQGYTVAKNTINHELMNSLAKESVIYLSPLDNTSFDEKRTKMLKNTLLRVLRRD